MYKTVARIKFPIQDKMHVSIHQHKCEEHYIVADHDRKNPVHPVQELIIIVKNYIYRISRSIEMPAVFNGNTLALCDGQSKTQIGRDFRLNYV